MFTGRAHKTSWISMKKNLLCFSFRWLLTGVLLVSFAAAQAEIHATITGTTNYVWRMYSKSNNKPALQANLDYQHELGFYTGVTASYFSIGPSEVDPSIPFKEPNVEIIPYVGWSFKLADDWRLDLQYSSYFYDEKVYAKPADYDEYYFFIHYKDLLSFQASYAQDFYGLTGDAFFYEGTARYPVTDFLEASGTFGYANTKSVLTTDYPYWNIGLTARYKFIALDLRYYEASEMNGSGDLDLLDHPFTQKGTIVFSLSAGF